MIVGKCSLEMTVSVVQYMCQKDGNKTIIDTDNRLGGYVYFGKPFILIDENVFPVEDISGHIRPIDKETVAEIIACKYDGKKVCSGFFRIPPHVGTIILTKKTAIPLVK